MDSLDRLWLWIFEELQDGGIETTLCLFVLLGTGLVLIPTFWTVLAGAIIFFMVLAVGCWAAAMDLFRY